jgi:hypothetical protein
MPPARLLPPCSLARSLISISLAVTCYVELQRKYAIASDSLIGIRLHHTSKRQLNPRALTAVTVQVVAFHVHESVLVKDGAGDGKPTVDVNRLQPLGRLGGNTYCRVGSTFDLPRPDRAPAAAGK